MGPQHAVCGLLAGVGVAAVVPSAPWPIRVLVVVVTGGAALLPDLDHPRATAARSLGPVTRAVAWGVDRVAVTVYHATRAAGDPAGRDGGHRLLTHTVPAGVLAGVLVGVAGVVYPVALVAVCGLLGGLLALGVQRAGGVLAVSCAAVSWWAVTQHPGWSWLVSIGVTVGCLVHLVGDLVTPSGVPVLWPLVSRGQRWRMVSIPLFEAGSPTECLPVAWILRAGLLVAVASVTGVLPVLVSAAVAAGGS